MVGIRVALANSAVSPVHVQIASRLPRLFARETDGVVLVVKDLGSALGTGPSDTPAAACVGDHMLAAGRCNLPFVSHTDENIDGARRDATENYACSFRSFSATNGAK
jgi:hypothetical protein